MTILRNFKHQLFAIIYLQELTDRYTNYPFGLELRSSGLI